MSNITGEDGSFSSGNTGEEVQQLHQVHGTAPSASAATNNSSQQQQPAAKKKRNLPGTPGN